MIWKNDLNELDCILTPPFVHPLAPSSGDCSDYKCCFSKILLIFCQRGGHILRGLAAEGGKKANELKSIRVLWLVCFKTHAVVLNSTY